MTPTVRPLRLFLDTGVIIGGCYDPMSAAHGILVLTVQTPNYVVVRAEAVEDELRYIIARRIRSLDSAVAEMVVRTLESWRKQAQTEWYANPTEAEVEMHLPTVLPALKHKNDLKPVVTAILARPDWVISSNTEHWNPQLASVTGLRIITPWDFLNRLRP